MHTEISPSQSSTSRKELRSRPPAPNDKDYPDDSDDNDNGDFPIIHLPPPGIYNGIYTGIYLPTFREGTHFIIKTVSFVSGGPYGPRGVLSDFEGGGGVPKVYNRTDPIVFLLLTFIKHIQ